MQLVGTIAAPTLVLVGELDTHAGGTGSHYDQSAALAELLPPLSFPVAATACFGSSPTVQPNVSIIGCRGTPDRPLLRLARHSPHRWAPNDTVGLRVGGGPFRVGRGRVARS